jgi:hypothetical protein
LRLLLGPHQHRAAAAESGHLRLDHADREGSRYGGVNGIAAFTQYG